MRKYILFVVIFGIFVNFNVNAFMVSFFILETGLPQNDRNNPHSITWENSLMDVFFEAGHIVSNAPILRLDSKPQGDIFQSISFNLTQARNMGIDYVMIAQLNFDNDSQIPTSVSFLIYRVNTREKLLDNKVQVNSYRSSREESDDIKSIIRGLLPYFNN